MNVRNYRFGLIFVFVAVVLLSCAPSARIPVLKPAEINLRGIDKIAIGDVQGNIGSSVADLLTSRLFESDQFDVVDRSNLSRIMKEHELNMSGAVDTDTAVKIGRLVGASALIVGNANVKYDLKRWKKKPWQDKEGKWHQSYNVKGTAKVNSTLKVIGLTTGKVLAVKSISKEAGDSDWKNNEWPQDPDRDAIISSAVNSMIDTFMKMIAPYTVYVNVKFEKSKLPESEAGTNFAKQGQWEDALEQFKSAKDKNPTVPCAWYNLGLAYEYNFMFRKAIEAFKEANKIKPCAKYVTEINNVKRLQADRKKLEAQGAINSEK